MTEPLTPDPISQARALLTQNPQAALLLAQQMLSAPATHTEGLLVSGLARHSLGQFEAAQQDFQAALGALGPDGDAALQADALNGQAEVLQQLGRRGEAISVLEQVLAGALATDHKPQLAQAHKLLGELCAEAEDYRAAYAHLNEFHRLDRLILDENTAHRLLSVSKSAEDETARSKIQYLNMAAENSAKALATAEQIIRERTEKLERTQIEIVNRLAIAAEYRDDETGEHTWRIGLYSAAIAKSMGLSAEEIQLLQQAARLHDVGKIGISDAVLMKEGSLTSDEFDLIKKHPVIGERILSHSESPLLQMAQVIALSHHERWDGGGYPLGLRGDDIPLWGRIVAIADVFDALTHVRPYKAAWSLPDALEELDYQSGKQFDPEILGHAISIFKNLSRLDVNTLAAELGVSAFVSSDDWMEKVRQDFASQMEAADDTLRRQQQADEASGLN